MAYQEDSAEARAGLRGERAVDQWMRAQGIWRLQVSNLGPSAMLVGPEGKLIALDRLYIGSGVTHWCDIKWKSGPILYGRTQTMRHGIDKKNWEHYLAVQKKTGIPAKLAIVELRQHRRQNILSPRLLIQDLDVLEEKLKTTKDGVAQPFLPRFPNGSVNWDRDDAFIDMGEIDIGEGEIPQTQCNLRPWEWPARDGTVRMPKKRVELEDLFTEAASENSSDAYAAAQGRRALPSEKH